MEGERVLARLRELPGGPALLALAEQRDDVELVGGAVRDLLLERTPRELDVVVAGDAPALAQELARGLGVEAVVHGRFGTAFVQADGARLDFATQRAESYPAPGALPEVRPGTPLEDLLRRDFTVNAIAVRLGGRARGELREAPHALADLRAGRLRVLHEQSFLDDPTRLLRLARYRARLGFAVEPGTAELARAALAAEALRSVSGARVGAELRLALAEPDALASLGSLVELGVLAAIHPRLRLDEPLIARALALLPADGRPEVLLLAALALPLALRADARPQAEIGSFLRRIETPHPERERTLAAAVAVPRLCEQLRHARSPSEIHAAAGAVPPEGVALAGALAASRPPAVGPEDGGGPRAETSPAEGDRLAAAARCWLTELRHVALEIDGEDLLAAGIPQGPEIGRRLHHALTLRLDGEIGPGREAELAAALSYGRRR